MDLRGCIEYGRSAKDAMITLATTYKNKLGHIPFPVIKSVLLIHGPKR